MTWFKNLRTIAKLMIGFGILALLMGTLGYVGLSGIDTINDKLATMYQRDLLGLAAIKDVATDVALIGRYSRNAVIEADMAAMQQDKLKIDCLYQQVDDAVARSEKTFLTEQGKALLAKLERNAAGIQNGHLEAVRVAMTNDKKAAAAELAKVQPIADGVIASTGEATSLKEKLAQESFDESGRLHDQSRIDHARHCVLR